MEITYIGGSFPDNLYILRIKLCISFFDLGLCNPDIIGSKGESVEFGGTGDQSGGNGYSVYCEGDLLSSDPVIS